MFNSGLSSQISSCCWFCLQNTLKGVIVVTFTRVAAENCSDIWVSVQRIGVGGGCCWWLSSR